MATGPRILIDFEGERSPADFARPQPLRWGLGDLVCCEPMVRGLRETYGAQAEIRSKGYCGNVAYSPALDGPAPQDFTADRVVSLRLWNQTKIEAYARLESLPSLVDHMLSYAEVWPEDRKPRLNLGPDELWFLKELDILNKLPRPIIIFCADNFDPYRSWPVQHYERLALHAKRRGASIIEVGVQAKLGVGTDFVNATTIRGTAALLSICDLFVGNSSGPLHFAQAGGTPCLAFFSLALPERFIHDDSLVSVVQSKDLDCIDCMTTNYVERNQKGCRSQPLAACMQELPYERGKEALDEIFDEYLADCPGPGEEGSLARTFRARVTTQQAARLLERGHVERAARFLGFAQERLGGVRDREAKV